MRTYYARLRDIESRAAREEAEEAEESPAEEIQIHKPGIPGL